MRAPLFFDSPALLFILARERPVSLSCLVGILQQGIRVLFLLPNLGEYSFYLQ